MSENNNKQKRKRVCPHCGRKSWMREFYPLKNGGRSSWCHECVLEYKRERYRKTRKVRWYFHAPGPRGGLWSITATRRVYSGTAICFPSCVATITIPSTGSWLKCSVFPNAVSPGRPEMGLEKDKGFVASLSREHLLLANARSKERDIRAASPRG